MPNRPTTQAHSAVKRADDRSSGARGECFCPPSGRQRIRFANACGFQSDGPRVEPQTKGRGRGGRLGDGVHFGPRNGRFGYVTDQPREIVHEFRGAGASIRGGFRLASHLSAQRQLPDGLFCIANDLSGSPMWNGPPDAAEVGRSFKAMAHAAVRVADRRVKFRQARCPRGGKVYRARENQSRGGCSCRYRTPMIWRCGMRSIG